MIREVNSSSLTEVTPVVPQPVKSSFQSALDVFKALENGRARAEKKGEPASNRVITIAARQATQPEATQKTEAEEIKNRDGYLWECVGRKPDEFGGYLYKFKLRNEFDNVTQDGNETSHAKAIIEKNNQIFPAVERSGLDSLILDMTSNRENAINQFIENAVNDLYRQILENTPEPSRSYVSFEFRLYVEGPVRMNLVEKIERFSQLGQLGYQLQTSQDGVYLNLPDREALLSRWEKLREKSPELPKLDLVNSEGIADDLDFVEAYLKHDALLSTGREFFHDSTVHLMPTLADILLSGKNGEPSYKTKREKVAKRVDELYQKILTAKSQFGKEDIVPENERLLLPLRFRQIELALGALVDTVSASDIETADKILDLPDSFFKHMWDLPVWQPYLKIRFGADELNSQKIGDFWEKIKAIDITKTTHKTK